MLELIDTCWDVNLGRTVTLRVDRKELIDTCWDVNIFGGHNNGKIKQELIDTCWDVNANSATNTNTGSSRINRYMLGCKCCEPCSALASTSN